MQRKVVRLRNRLQLEPLAPPMCLEPIPHTLLLQTGVSPHSTVNVVQDSVVKAPEVAICCCEGDRLE